MLTTVKLAEAFNATIQHTAHETTFGFKLPNGVNDKGKLTFSTVRAVIECPDATINDALTYVAKLRSVNVRTRSVAGFAPIGIGRVLVGDECAILCALVHSQPVPSCISVARREAIAKRYLERGIGTLKDDSGFLVFGDALASMIPAPAPQDNGTSAPETVGAGKNGKNGKGK